jgi:AcrR family transcriptional regulator
MKEKIKSAKNKRPENDVIVNRGGDTRKIILEAAKKVFAAQPYNAASIRMIAARGNFYHGLIRYHFPNKAKIFEAVVEETCRSLHTANREWLKEVSAFPATEALSIYLKRFIDFFREQPEVFQIIVKCSSHDDPATLPGYHHLKALLFDTKQDFENTLPGLFSHEDVSRYLTSFHALIMYYLGFSSIEAEIIGFSGPDEQYLQWVQETLYFIYLPILEKAIHASANAQ